MSQSTDQFTVANGSGATVRAGLNADLLALASLSSGTSAPPNPTANMFWKDTTGGLAYIKHRNAANSAWDIVASVDETSNIVSTGIRSLNAQTGTSYAIGATDNGKVLTFTNAAAIAVSIAQATTAGFGVPFSCELVCKSGSVGSVTITPMTSTIDGAATLVLAPGTSVKIISDGTNYQIAAKTS